ncbi:MAG: hypothetical protein CSA81_07730 [Acidobacteria bacterium]|nr:MAG: hypothetical protein CSA81_07730 [Acidobacteriota bacterium]
MEQTADLKLKLSGRFYSALSFVPVLLGGAVLFYVLTSMLVFLVLQDLMLSFDVVFLPFMLAFFFAVPLYLGFLFILKWQANRYLRITQAGLTFVNTNKRETFSSWDQLQAVELRFARPRTVQCTMVFTNITINFTNLEINLDTPVQLPTVFKRGFEYDKMRDFLLLVDNMSPKCSWKMSNSFKVQFGINFPPYDLEKLK